MSRVVVGSADDSRADAHDRCIGVRERESNNGAEDGESGEARREGNHGGELARQEIQEIKRSVYG